MNHNHSAGGVAQSGYLLLIRASSHLQSFVLLVIRLAWGFELFITARAHLADVPAMAKRFTEWGVPFPTANVYISGTTEMIGGILLILGLASRFISIPLVFNFIVAYLTASKATVAAVLKHPIRVDSWDTFFGDTAWPFLVAALVVLAFGPGKVSVDYLLQKYVFRTTPAPRPLY